MTELRGLQPALRTQLAERHREAYGWALACCNRNPHEAQDVLQTAYLKVLDGRAQFDGNSSFKTWLFGVIRLTAADGRRRWRLRHFLLERFVATEPATADVPGPDLSLEQRQQRDQFLASLQMLPGRQRETLFLVFYHDLSLDEAARVMAVSVGTARQHYERGKAKLKRLLADGADGADGAVER
jgi:RNA polymerase sigma-70 factor (ECF subfamily)